MGYKGWMEMPGDQTNNNYIYYTHDKLPSNGNLRNYTFCLDKTKYCALWIAYPLHSCYLLTGNRTDDFGYDPQIPEIYQAYLTNRTYTSGFDRGHQLPSADRNLTRDDNRTTFYSTNMTPQRSGLNQKEWGILENKIRTWICSDTLYVVTGAYFDPNRTIATAQDNNGTGKDCPVPSHYYKVLIRSKSGSTDELLNKLPASNIQCIGFWFDHDDPSTWKIASSIRSVAEIEKLTGLKFFVNIPNAPKDQKDISLWTGI